MALAAVLGMLVLILDSRCALEGAAEGLQLCLGTVIPALFPFLLLSNVFLGSFQGTSSALARFFRLPEGTEGLLVPGFLGGYPLGAQAIGRAWQEGALTRDQAERLLGYCCNCGPAFVFGMAASMVGGTGQGLALWGIHILSSLLVSRLFPAQGSGVLSPEKKTAPAMTGALRAMGNICGWVMVMRVVIAFLDRWVLWLLPREGQVLLWGLLELTNGICGLEALGDPRLRFFVACPMLSFGGLCVALQTASVAPGLKLRGYFRGKILQALFSLLLAAGWCFAPWVIPAVTVFLFLPEKRQIGSRNPREAVV